MGPIIHPCYMTHHTPTFWSCNCISMISCRLVTEQTQLFWLLPKTDKIKPYLIGKKSDVHNILSTGNNYIIKLSRIFKTLHAILFFQFMHWCYLVGMQVQMLLQHYICAATWDIRLLCQFTYINKTTKNEVVSSIVVQVHGDFWLTLHTRAHTHTHTHTRTFATVKLASDCEQRSLCTKPIIILLAKPNENIVIR
jgi:hypothetical protein